MIESMLLYFEFNWITRKCLVGVLSSKSKKTWLSWFFFIRLNSNVIFLLKSHSMNFAGIAKFFICARHAMIKDCSDDGVRRFSIDLYLRTMTIDVIFFEISSVDQTCFSRAFITYLRISRRRTTLNKR